MKVLSIDGGGVRGMLPALVLAEIEKRMGKRIAEMFDLIVGTSTGGILGLGLVKSTDDKKPQYSAEELVDIYRTRSAEIFAISAWRKFRTGYGLTDEMYSNNGLKTILSDYFGDELLGNAVTSVMVTSYDIQNREPLFLKSWDTRHTAVAMKDAALATSAAPTYFEPALVPIGSSIRALVDGGVFVNSPAMSAYAEALTFDADASPFVLSLGTGELVRPIAYSDAVRWGKAGWLAPLISCMFDGASDAVDYQMRAILGNENYIRLQTNLAHASDDMDDATPENIGKLEKEASRLISANESSLSRICDVLVTDTKG